MRGISTASWSSIRWNRAVVAVAGVCLLTACTFIQPPPTVRHPQHHGPDDSACATALSRAHGALAAAGAAAGDPAGTAAAHAAHAAAMDEYHTCG